MSVVVVVVLAMFISNLSSDKIAHVHIYATTILCVIFWIKSNIKICIFLTSGACRATVARVSESRHATDARCRVHGHAPLVVWAPRRGAHTADPTTKKEVLRRGLHGGHDPEFPLGRHG